MESNKDNIYTSSMFCKHDKQKKSNKLDA